MASRVSPAATLISASSRRAVRIVRIFGQRGFDPLLQQAELFELGQHERRLRQDAAAVANQITEFDVGTRWFVEREIARGHVDFGNLAGRQRQEVTPLAEVAFAGG